MSPNALRTIIQFSRRRTLHWLVLAAALVMAFTVVLPTQSVEAQIPGCTVRQDWNIYTVVAGDTVGKIARRFGSTINALVIGNCMSNPNLIYVGQQLRVPPTGNNNGGGQLAMGATYQAFERGFMIWRGDTGLIMVFHGSGTGGLLQYFPIYAYTLLPNNPIPDVPPAGLQKPIFGFGKVWGNVKSVRDSLGWAKSSEQGYAAIYSYTYGSSRTSITLPDGRSTIMESGTWAFSSGTIATPTPTLTPPPSAIGATFQPFERGFMLWLATTGNVYTFFGTNNNDGAWGGIGSFSVWTSSMYGNLPSNPATETPPSGRFHPQMGFGKVWWNFPTVRGNLGWATTPEQGYLATYLVSGTAILISLPDGRQARLEGIQWTLPRTNTVPQPTATSTPQPDATATPTPTNTPALAYEVVSFSADPNAIGTLGANVNILWEVRGLSFVQLDIYESETAVNPLITLANQPNLGRYTFPAPNNITQGSLKVVLSSPVGIVPGQQVPLSTLLIPVNIAPIIVTTQAAYQPYQNGYMLWRADTGDILTFTYTGAGTRVAYFSLNAYDSLPANQTTDPLPEGMVMPINGFGRVWYNYPDVRAGLGWATAAEAGFTTTITTTPTNGMEAIVYTLPDGRTVEIFDGVWAR